MTEISTLAGLEREAAELAAEQAPRRFALCWIDVDEEDGGVLYWGLEFRDGDAVVCGDSGRSFGIFQGAEAARRRFSRARTVTLVWLDGPRRPDAPPPPEASLVREPPSVPDAGRGSGASGE